MAAVLGLATKEVEAACEEASQQASLAVAAKHQRPGSDGDFGRSRRRHARGEACKKRAPSGSFPQGERRVSLAVDGPREESPSAGPRACPVLGSGFPRGRQRHRGAVHDAGRARRLLADQLTAAVRWVECMQHAARLGSEGARFVEIGPAPYSRAS